MKKDQSAKAVNQSKPGIIRKLHNSGRNAFSAKLTFSRRALRLPCALGLLMSAAMLACGSDDTQQQPGSDQPAAATAQENTNATASTSGGNQPEQSSNDGRNAPAERTAPERERENDATVTTPPTATPAPTPTPEPTATPAPTPTPDPRVSTMELLTKRNAGPGSPLVYQYVYDYNHLPIIKALLQVEPLLDAYMEAGGGRPDFYTRKRNGAYFRTRLERTQMEFERIESDSSELHVKITVPLVIGSTQRRTATSIETEEIEYQITGNAVFELTPTEDFINTQHETQYVSRESLAQYVYGAQHVPTFSHFTSEPAMEKQ